MKKLFLLLILCFPLAALADAIDGTYARKALTRLDALAKMALVFNSKDKSISFEVMKNGAMQTRLLGHYRIEGSHLICINEWAKQTFTLVINNDGSLQNIKNPAEIFYKK